MALQGVTVADPCRRLEDVDSEETRAGHSLGKPASRLMEEAAERRAFPTHVMDLKV